jgi:8-oxo-dGTP pyrophosphatase MutT (NUDIX family)
MKPVLSLNLKKEIEANLPGKEAHLKMLPKGRFIYENPVIKRNAAVAILIYPNAEGEEELIFIKRTEYEGHHSGQVSFQGGKEDKEDNSLVSTAIRECYEEIGIKLLEKNLIGALTPVYVMVSEFMVYPYIFIYPSVPELLPDPAEVKYTIRFPLYKLLDPNIRKEKTMQIMGHNIDVPYFHIENETVWGATAMMLSEFIEILLSINNKNQEVINAT